MPINAFLVKKEGKFLGHAGLSPLPEKVETLKNFPLPEMCKSYLGGYAKFPP